jgi:hypothetical protein
MFEVRVKHNCREELTESISYILLFLANILMEGMSLPLEVGILRE